MPVCVQANLVNSMHLPSLTSQRHISLNDTRDNYHLAFTRTQDPSFIHSLLLAVRGRRQAKGKLLVSSSMQSWVYTVTQTSPMMRYKVVFILTYHIILSKSKTGMDKREFAYPLSDALTIYCLSLDALALDKQVMDAV